MSIIDCIWCYRRILNGQFALRKLAQPVPLWASYIDVILVPTVL